MTLTRTTCLLKINGSIEFEPTGKQYLDPPPLYPGDIDTPCCVFVKAAMHTSVKLVQAYMTLARLAKRKKLPVLSTYRFSTVTVHRDVDRRNGMVKARYLDETDRGVLEKRGASAASDS